jgi:hydroxyacylglutathione hydrolase
MAFEIFEHLVVGPLGCNCYIVGDSDTRDAIVIDPGGDPDRLETAITSRGLRIAAIVATHAHFDHVIAAEVLREKTGAPFYLHAKDGPVLDWYAESGLMFLGIELPPPPTVDSSPAEGDQLRAGFVSLEVFHTPGHSPGSISLVHESALFSGDTLFAGSIGRSDLPGGDTDALLGSIRSKLFSLAEDLPVYPGHGPQTTIESERRSNPFVGDGARMWLPPSN